MEKIKAFFARIKAWFTGAKTKAAAEYEEAKDRLEEAKEHIENKLGADKKKEETELEVTVLSAPPASVEEVKSAAADFKVVTVMPVVKKAKAKNKVAKPAQKPVKSAVKPLPKPPAKSHKA